MKAPKVPRLRFRVKRLKSSKKVPSEGSEVPSEGSVSSVQRVPKRFQVKVPIEVSEGSKCQHRVCAKRAQPNLTQSMPSAFS